MRRAAAFALAALVLAFAASALHTEQEPRFTFVDVWVDSGSRPLAAWQLRLVEPSGRVRLVGVEGGDDPAWAAPPYHDPAALQGGTIVLAAYHLGRGAPSGRVRVARLHVQVDGPAPPNFGIELEVAASDEGPIPGASASVVR